MVIFGSSQFRYLALVLVSWLTVFFATRCALLLAHLSTLDLSAPGLATIFGVGLLHDLAFVAYAAVGLALYLLLCPGKYWHGRKHGLWLTTLFALGLFTMFFIAVSEWLFWDEFGVRFNFIAVDYLVYSDEVINNILESYPIYPLIALLAVMAAVATYLMQPALKGALTAPVLPWRQRAIAYTGLIACALVVAAEVNQHTFGEGGNTYQRELAGNGPYQFFAAFRNNELDYRQFYATLADAKAGQILRSELSESNVRFLNRNPLDVRRTVDNSGEPLRRNVVLVVIESLSAKYLGSFGNIDNLTPNLDSLRHDSLFFNQCFATGTRTDRGLEAITLSIPPTPGRSIVKRLGRESGYGSLGQQLTNQGYDSVFLYGGRGYFDNMGAFFSGNGYRVVDQDSVPASNIHFKNAWGMADEDLYHQVIQVADVDYAAHKPFFLQVMTTSNHRPYTYPDGRIDIPSGDGRKGAVKYTDYAIGEFLAAARSKPWFGNTLFVFVADHTAGSAGQEDLPVADYHIPLFIYAPELVAAQDFNGLTSQIDLAPTLLGLLNLDYTSTFFGHNVLTDENQTQRILIGNYQHLGLFDGRDLAILSPRAGLRRHEDALGLSLERAARISDPLIMRDIAYYQAASYGFQNGLLNWQREQVN